MSDPLDDEDGSPVLVEIDDVAPYIHLTANVQMVEVESDGTVVVHGPAPWRIESAPDGLMTGWIDSGGLHIPTGPAYIESAESAGIPVVYV